MARLRHENKTKSYAPKRSVEAALSDLKAKFGFSATKGFKKCLKDGDVKTAENWLNRIENEPGNFPQYLATWDNWLRDRKDDIEKAKNNDF